VSCLSEVSFFHYLLPSGTHSPCRSGSLEVLVWDGVTPLILEASSLQGSGWYDLEETGALGAGIVTLFGFDMVYNGPELVTVARVDESDAVGEAEGSFQRSTGPGHEEEVLGGVVEEAEDDDS